MSAITVVRSNVTPTRTSSIRTMPSPWLFSSCSRTSERTCREHRSIVVVFVLVNVHRKHSKMRAIISPMAAKWPFSMQRTLHVNVAISYMTIARRPTVFVCFSLNRFVIHKRSSKRTLKSVRVVHTYAHVSIRLRYSQEVKLKSPDYTNISQDEAVADFLSRIRLYEQRYEPIDDKTDEKNFSFIKIFNCGERFLVHKIGGKHSVMAKRQRTVTDKQRSYRFEVIYKVVWCIFL
jgi:hypothetical protein